MVRGNGLQHSTVGRRGVRLVGTDCREGDDGSDPSTASDALRTGTTDGAHDRRAGGHRDRFEVERRVPHADLQKFRRALDAGPCSQVT